MGASFCRVLTRDQKKGQGRAQLGGEQEAARERVSPLAERAHVCPLVLDIGGQRSISFLRASQQEATLEGGGEEPRDGYAVPRE
eukprot:1438121-Pyramimonas_sp.AAC.1